MKNPIKKGKLGDFFWRIDYFEDQPRYYRFRGVIEKDETDSNQTVFTDESEAKVWYKIKQALIKVYEAAEQRAKDKLNELQIFLNHLKTLD